MKRSQLKAIIKECMLEILEEGLGSSALQVEGRRRRNTRAPVKAQRKTSTQQKRHHPGLDTPVGEMKEYRQPISNLTNDPTMQSLLEDTANTTLQEQISAEREGSRKAATDIPLEALGQLGSRMGSWETLAFSDPIQKNSQ